ncbi:HAMP domain-containing sensor histidine kinase [uncultured Xylophilus sp.]|uniref:sensor histidine kinase n=1 Tax=uncultured Xylophilus sp. TaxID=296832 RepID=UPI0025E24DCF|nr:HAMP domain-containing sensor histidine kinase [uncultured Xylophilus sp.]
MDASRQTGTTLALQYAASTVAFLVALAVRFAAQGLLPPTGFPFLSFFPAVLIVSFLTSLGPALWCAALSTIAAWYFFMPPIGRFFPLEGRDAFALAFFAVILVIDCVVIARMKDSMRQLRKVEADLRAADRQKDEFLAMLAHELRNPLHVIQMSARVMGARLEGRDRERIALMERQGRQMERLVDDLLDSARISTGKIHVAQTPLDLRALVDQACQAFVVVAAQRGQTVAWDLPAAPVMIAGDATRLTQVVENLLSNASKFSPADAELRVAMDATADTARVAVIDRGRGLTAAQREQVFGMFVQAEDGDARLGGLGIGLALARHIVERHGGTLDVASDGPGHGATFTFVVPRLVEAALHGLRRHDADGGPDTVPMPA